MRWAWSALLVGCAAPPAAPAPPAPPASARCGERAALALEVLGSGGPIPDDARASSAYVVWVEGKARILIDLGGGALVRFAESGARIADLEAVVLSHLHVDHAGDFAGLMKGAYFSDRERPLVVAGPSGNERFPALSEYVKRLLAPETGAFRYLSGFLTGDEDFSVEMQDVPAEATEPVTILGGDVRVDAVGVHHGSVPALGVRVRVGEHTIVFGGDQSAQTGEGFTRFASGADLLVVHHALPEEGFDGVRHLHRIPSEIGELAAATNPKTLVLSHHMQRALRDLEAGRAAIGERWSGPVKVADDHACYPIR